MERHPAGCDPSVFRSLPTPARLPGPSSQSNRTSVPPKAAYSTRQDRVPSQHDDLLRVPGIESALVSLEAVASDIVQPVTKYNRYTYLSRFNAAAQELADAFIAHINQIRRQEIRAHNRKTLAPVDRYPASSYLKPRRLYVESSDSDEPEGKKRSQRLANKRRRTRYVSSSDNEDEYVPGEYRASRPKRSKEIRSNLNDDLAYDLMARRTASPERPQHLKRPRDIVEMESSEEEEELGPIDIALRVVRPLPFVRRRPLASDNSSLTPFIQDEDDSTDTEQQRRDHARRPLKSVIYGPGRAEFTEKELRPVFPAQGSKRRMRCDSLVLTSRRPPPGYSSSIPWKPEIVKLCTIPRDMMSRYMNGTCRLSPSPDDISDLHIFPQANGAANVPGASRILTNQRLSSSERDTRDGDSGKASSPGTYVLSGSSTTGSPRAKKPEIQNGHMDIELGPSLSSLDDRHREERPRSKGGEETRRKNGTVHPASRGSVGAWKDLAPYGRVPPQPQPQQGPMELQNVNVPGKSGINEVLQTKQTFPANASVQHNRTGHITMKHDNGQNVGSQSQKLAPTAPARNSQAPLRTNMKQGPSQSRKQLAPSPPQPSPASSPASQGIQKASPPLQVGQTRKASCTPQEQLSTSKAADQMIVVARGSAAMATMGMQQLPKAFQPQLNLQPQATILAAVPVQIAGQQVGLPQPFPLQQLGQDPRLLPQWQLQNTGLQQAHGTLQLSPGYVAVNNVFTPTASGPASIPNRYVSMQAGVPITTNALVPAGTSVRPDVLNIQPNVVAAQPTVEPTASSLPASPPGPSGRPGNFNSQLQEQYQKHYEEMYTKHYQKNMQSLKQERHQNGST